MRRTAAGSLTYAVAGGRIARPRLRPIVSATAPDSAADDRELAARAQAGDESAFGELMRKHHERVFRLVYAVVRHEHDAREVAQDVWLGVWRQLPGYRGDAKFTTWLHPIAVRRAIDHSRRQRRWFSRLLPFGDPDRGGVPEPAAPEPSAGDERRDERIAQLRRAIEALPPRQRAVLALRELEGLSYEEIAAATKIPVGTVMSRLHHARRLLAQKLGAQS